ncbi:low molecular weight phosphatase family protein [Tersicoccus solisilvae]|uniref:Protein tyrosine phosphatase n=3 Tax=Micrococcales TaxID=85006 RepID=A0A075JCM9_9MICO|nr:MULTISPECIES: protein-tyrosine-phosphatase [Micrococcales]OMH37118.1 protein tyrosine phosphatase [Tersicoccus sp. Bi-70]AIF39704.1 protein tyrosine phosphatase [Dermacoccus nishinomiyaensis]MCT1605259.1 low molecular weight phosphatase family protein [Dermacoccus nishinomiyaensis]NHC32399.1 low molecular weight phosphatase family protein [Dermacoccus nishinomiyaensis]GGC97855.1 low molecular weight phosphatase family protein [Tersicoccus solisilvae]
MTTKPTVLFICKHNAGRSQLGAALLELAAPDRYTATSAGITPADEVNPSIAATVGELGLDITARMPRRVTPDLLEHADIVVLMKPGLELPAEPGGTVLEWSFPDPNSWSPEDVRPMRDAVAERIERELLQP